MSFVNLIGYQMKAITPEILLIYKALKSKQHNDLFQCTGTDTIYRNQKASFIGNAQYRLKTFEWKKS